MIKIIGAGLAGLLAANVLRKHSPIVLEAQKSLPNNHTALLRHRGNEIAEASAIPFTEVNVTKGIVFDGEPYQYAHTPLVNMYSRKVTGAYSSRSIKNLEDAKRYIAPPDFISRLADGVQIEYGHSVSVDDLINADEPIISTVPMPIMYEILKEGLEIGCKPEFNYRQTHNVNVYIEEPDCDVYHTVYYPGSETGIYRMSITGNKVTAEYIRQPMHKKFAVDEITKFLERDFGISGVSLSEFKHSEGKYGKIREIDASWRKQFICELTDKFNIYSLGRFATWRNILLDDVLQDVHTINDMIANGGYKTRLGK